MSAIPGPVESLQRLVSFPSVSSTSNEGVSDLASGWLDDLGFSVERSTYTDPGGVKKVNIVACRQPNAKGVESPPIGLAYFCHTDVVPVPRWSGPGNDPFSGEVVADRVYGRGSCDMKGSLAAMLQAASRVDRSEQRAPLWIVCTADEEVGFQGAKHVVRYSEAYRTIVDRQPLAVIGEPTGLQVVHAHKGIVGFQITSRGRAAHSSTQHGVNANEPMVPMLRTLLELCRRSREDEALQDHRFDPPTLSWNFGVSDGGSAVNVTPEKSVAWVSLRPMPEISGQALIDAAAERAAALGLEFELMEGGGPFFADPESEYIRELCEIANEPARTVCYGTDGGELAELDHRIVIGPGDIAQAHTADEWISVQQLHMGCDLYEQMIRRWCT